MNPVRTHKQRVLVVEDHPGVSFGLRVNLEVEGYEVLVEADGATAASTKDTFRPHIILLDLTLPGVDGIELLRRWRARDSVTRIIIVTGRDTESDKVTGLGLGADDYVTKPFGVRELMARVDSQLRRAEHDTSAHANTMWIGEACVDFAARTVTRAGKVMHVPPREFSLLDVLLANPNVVLSRQRIMKEAWGWKAELDTKSVEVHICSLRQKIEAHSHKPKYILTVNRVGYRLQL